MTTHGMDDAGGTPIPPIVLVVEDDRATRDMYEALLNAEGFWVLKVADAFEAMEYAKDFQPAVLLKPVSPAALVERLTAALHDSTVLRARGRCPIAYGSA